MAVLVKVPERVQKICEDIAGTVEDAVAPNGFKGTAVTFDQGACLLCKAGARQAAAARGTGYRYLRDRGR